LSTNYRSSSEIIELANAVVESDASLIKKAMKPCAEGETDTNGFRPSLTYCDTHVLQCTKVVDKIREYIKEGYNPASIAVLCPQNQYLYGVEELLTSRGVPSVLLDGRSDKRSRPKPDHVCLSTIHKAKGLEWDVVFLIAMNDDVLPSRKDAESVSEGRRLFYVGVTRAKHMLHMLFSPVYSCNNVSRYVSEIPFNSLLELHNCKPSNFMQSTKTWSLRSNKSLKQLLRAMAPQQFSLIRHFVPNVPKTEEKCLHDGWEYPEFVTKDDMYDEYESFIKITIQKMFSKSRPNAANVLHHPSASKIIAGVVLDASEMMRYNKYKQNFKDNLSDIGRSLRSHKDIFTARAKLLSFFMNGSRMPLVGTDVSIVLGILQKMKKAAEKNNIPLQNVAILNDSGLAEDMRRRLAASYTVFNDTSKSWVDAMHDMWQISKCDRFVEDNRKRMLYKHVSEEVLMSNMVSFYNMYDGFVKGVMEEFHDVEFHVDVSNKGNDSNKAATVNARAFAVLTEEKGKCLLMIKCSDDGGTRHEVLLECMCVKAMIADQIDWVLIYNPIRGVLKRYDMRSVDACAVMAVVSGATCNTTVTAA
jgi:hypothetical protein